MGVHDAPNKLLYVTLAEKTNTRKCKMKFTLVLNEHGSKNMTQV